MLRLAIVIIVLTFLAACAAVGSSGEATSAAPADHPRLAQMHQADQAARATSPIDWDRVAAMVMQHGTGMSDYQLAFSLARLSMTLDPSSRRSRWLTAAAWDRILMSKGVEQWYGTQFASPGPNEPMTLYPVHQSAVSDEERAAMNVPSLQESREMARRMNP